MMNIFKTLQETYQKTQEAGKIRTANSIINDKFGIGISARALKDYFDTSRYDDIFEDNNLAKFFKEMLTEEEATSLNEELLNIEGLNKEVEEEKIKPVATNESIDFSLSLPLGKMIKQAVSEMAPKFDEDNKNLIKKLVKEAAKELQPNIININQKEVGEVKGKTHRDFKKALDILVSQKKLFLKGEAGTGKTFLAEQLAKAMSLEFDSLSLTAGISEGYLIGRTNIQGAFITTRFIDLYENGGVFLLDEVDAADSNTLLILNKAISSDSMPVPMRTDNPVAKRHENFYIICAANTWGNGAELDYAGREILDEAFLNRFSVAKLELDWDKDLERQLLGDEKELCDTLHALRKRVKENGLNRIITTRTMVDAYRYKLTGKTVEEVIDQVVVGWTEEETKKVINKSEQ